MKTRITTLNSRSNARFPWPEEGVLYHPETRGQCCIGQQGRQNAGISLDTLTHGMPCTLWHDPDWVRLWYQTVPEDTCQEIWSASGYEGDYDYDLAGAIAAHLNDEVAHDQGRPEAAVAGLRILWRWLGETQGERWIIRWLRDDDEEE